MKAVGRPLLVSAGLAALVVGLAGSLSCSASTSAIPERDDPALPLLQSAAHTSVAHPWTGTHRVVWLRGGLPRLMVVQVAHDPHTGMRSQVRDVGKLAIPAALDASKLDILARHFDLVLAGKRSGALVVEARRVGQSGPGAVAARFWLHQGTGMVIRRDVMDADGSLVRSSVLEDVSMGKAPAVAPALLAGSAPTVPPAKERGLDDAALSSLTGQGWPVPRSLPGGMDLLQAQLHDRDGAEVLQLSYTDGLSTMSLFVQAGELTKEPAGTARPVEDALVWVQPGPPERIVWAGEGHTWTLVSDAPDSAVRRTLMSLPHAPRQVEDGAADRLWRGMAVVGGWLNPFS